LASYRLGRRLQLDPAQEQVVGDDEANRLLRGSYRIPYIVPEEILKAACRVSRFGTKVNNYVTGPAFPPLRTGADIKSLLFIKLLA
jgi:hypothetical protein